MSDSLPIKTGDAETYAGASTNFKVEHAEAASLWLLCAVQYIDSIERAALKSRLIDFTRLIVADAKESSIEDRHLAPENQNSIERISEYDNWLVSVINRHLLKLAQEFSGLSGVARKEPAYFSRGDLLQAVSIHQRTRSVSTRLIGAATEISHRNPKRIGSG
jgi:hypothetical protein